MAESLAARDKADSTRSVAPLAKADDAVYIDTTGVPVEAATMEEGFEHV